MDWRTLVAFFTLTSVVALAAGQLVMLSRLRGNDNIFWRDLVFVGRSIRLVGGRSSMEGRVEVRRNDIWGTVCDDSFNNNAAKVVCRSLGLSTFHAIALPRAHFGRGTGRITLDDVYCTGNEKDIWKCRHRQVLTHNCGHHEDVGVRCGNWAITGTRLVGGRNRYEGRVEVRLHGIWGTVCDDSFNNNAAKVVCRSLGLPFPARALSYATFGRGTGRITLDDVRCTGRESSIFYCPHRDILTHNCGHNEDAGVRCGNWAITGIRLVGGRNRLEGRVEVRLHGIWGTVCHDFFNHNAAKVICRSLRLPYAGAWARTYAHFGRGTGPITLDDVICTGTESSLDNCRHTPYLTHTCNHGHDVGVTCGGTSITGIRLSRSQSSLEGRVEVRYRGVWGTVCDHSFNDNAAKVVCRSLGHPYSGAWVRPRDYFDQSSTRYGQITLDDVVCRGTEPSLNNCQHRTILTHNCNHYHDVGVTCADLSITGIRLSGGRFEGRVEVRYRDIWGTVCDDSFNNNAAKVVCRSLGHPSSGALARPSAFFGQGTGRITLDDVVCRGSETSINNCRHRTILTHNCGHSEDVGVICGNSSITGIRLVSGVSPLNGRVEVRYQGNWGTVCDDYFDNNAAKVVCRSLGHPTSTAMAKSGAFFGLGTGRITLDDVRCMGNEADLNSCPRSPLLTHNCRHTQDVGVSCDNSSITDIRLVGGRSRLEGQVEVRYQGNWSAVCDCSFDNNAAKVVCRSLGYPTAVALAKRSAHIGPRTRPIALHDVRCTGRETSLHNCRHRASWFHNCIHSEDVGVTCVLVSDLNFRLLPRCNMRIWGDPHIVTCNDTARQTTCSAPGLQTYLDIYFLMITGVNRVIRGNITVLSEVTIEFKSLAHPHAVTARYHTQNSTFTASFEYLDDIVAEIDRVNMTRFSNNSVSLVWPRTGIVIMLNIYGNFYQLTMSASQAIMNTGTGLLIEGCPADQVLVSPPRPPQVNEDETSAREACRARNIPPNTADMEACIFDVMQTDDATIAGATSTALADKDTTVSRDEEMAQTANVLSLDVLAGSGPDSFLLVLNIRHGGVYRMDLSPFSYSEIPHGRHGRLATVGYDHIDQKLYWLDVGSKQITSSNLDGSDIEVVLKLTSNAVPRDLAVDPISRNLFFTDTGTNTITVVKLDGFARRDIITSARPHDIAVHPGRGLIFWIDRDSTTFNTTIERANMDGSNRAVIVNLMSIIGLVIDYSTNLLYWTDLGAFAIQKSDFNGNGRVTIHTEPGDPFGYMFFVIQNHIYFTNRRDENHIVGIDTDWNDWEAVGPPQLGGYSGYKAGDGIYGLPANGCTTANGNCRSICVPMPRNRIACL